MMPAPPIKWLAFAFLGLPGLILWGGGGCLALSLIGAMAFESSNHPAVFLGSAAATLIGYLMMVASCLLRGDPRYRFPGKQLATVMTFEIGSQIGFSFSFLSGIGWLGSYLDGNALWQQAAYILGAISFSLITWLLLKSLRVRRTR
jgi:hypothetical protein